MLPMVARATIYQIPVILYRCSSKHCFRAQGARLFVYKERVQVWKLSQHFVTSKYGTYITYYQNSILSSVIIKSLASIISLPFHLSVPLGRRAWCNKTGLKSHPRSLQIKELFTKIALFPSLSRLSKLARGTISDVFWYINQ
jgi:hypothetical protein